jgi:hypothetical protein
LRDPILKKIHHTKGAGWVAQHVGSEFKLQYHKKRRERGVSDFHGVLGYRCSSDRNPRPLQG